MALLASLASDCLSLRPFTDSTRPQRLETSLGAKGVDINTTLWTPSFWHTPPNSFCWPYKLKRNLYNINKAYHDQSSNHLSTSIVRLIYLHYDYRTYGPESITSATLEMSSVNQQSTAITSLGPGPQIKKPTFAQALQMARGFYGKMPEDQKVEKERLLAAKESRFFTKDGIPPLIKVMAERIYNGASQQLPGPALRAPMASGHHKQAQHPPVQLPPRTQQRTDQGHVRCPAVQRQPVQKLPTLLLPTAHEHAVARLPAQQELQARQWLTQGVLLDGQTPTSICRAHNEQVRDLQVWGSTLTGGYFAPAVPSTPEAFRETITSETALLPMCRGCAITEGAVTVSQDEQGQVVHQLQVLDTCTCATDITNGKGESCWFCEVARIEAAKQVTVMKRAAKQHNGEPLLMAATNHQVLTCGCGQLVRDLPEAARKCIGCGGIKTTPFTNYAGTELIFTAVSEKVEAVIDVTTRQPVAAAPTNDIPPSIPQDQQPAATAVTAALPNGMDFNLNVTVGQDLNENEPDDQMKDTTKRSRKRKHAFGDGAASQPKRAKPQPQKARVQKPGEGEKLLFEHGAAQELTSVGLNVFLHYHEKDLAMIPARRAEILLRDNLEHMFGPATTIHAVLQCGLEEHDAGMLMRDVHGRYGDVVTGAQILKTLLESGTLPLTPVNGPNQTQTVSQHEHVPLHPIFNIDEKLALMKLGFQVRFNGHPEGSNATPSHRAEVLLNDNINSKIEITRLVEALDICGIRGWRMGELELDLAGEQRTKHVSIEHAMERMRLHGILFATAPSAPTSTFAGVDVGGPRMKDSTASSSATAAAPSPTAHMASLHIDQSTADSAFDDVLDPLHRPRNVQTAKPAAAPVDLPEMQVPLAFSLQDTYTLQELGLQTVPALDASLSPAKRAEGLLEANRELRRPNELDVVLETCGYDRGVAKEMVGSFYDFYDDDASCGDLLVFFEGEFATG